MVAFGIDYGTSSEFSLFIKPGKKVILVELFEEANNSYKKLTPNQIFVIKDYKEVIEIIKKELQKKKNSRKRTFIKFNEMRYKDI